MPRAIGRPGRPAAVAASPPIRDPGGVVRIVLEVVEGPHQLLAVAEAIRRQLGRSMPMAEAPALGYDI